jgi:FADH2 O2-dependent halogenase
MHATQEWAMQDCDVAIVGAGFGGSILAMVARRLGRRVALLERGRHPRFAIGESSSPLAGILLEQLAARYDLPRLAPLAAHGLWQRSCPQLTCGLKRGFSYFKHEEGRAYRVAPGRSNQLLVAASPNDELSDTHWLRADVDAFLVEEAVALGVDYLDELTLDRCEWEAGGGARLTGHRHGGTVSLRAAAVLDASGPGGFLVRTLGVGDHGFADYPRTQALYAHFTGVARCDAMPEYQTAAVPPYPIDDAALHHVFDGGWMWVLRFNNGVTSTGVAVTDALAADLRLADGAPAWRRLLDRFPTLAAQFADAVAVRPFTWMPRLAYRAGEVVGPSWAMLPSAAAFVDPLFSTGFPLTLLGVERLARAMEQGWARGRGQARVEPQRGNAQSSDARRVTAAMDGYAAATAAEADATAAFIAGCYAAFPDFERFSAYAMFYFAAASFSEAARRCDAPHAPARFLAGDVPAFTSALRRLSPRLASARESDAAVNAAVSAVVGDVVSNSGYASAVAEAVAPLNIAGLCDPAKENWYNVDIVDAVRGAAKLGVSPEHVQRGLAFETLATAAARAGH